MQERVSGDDEVDPLANALDFESVHAPHRCLRLALGGTKGGKIVFADEKLGRTVHRLDVKSAMEPPGMTRGESRPNAAIEQDVSIAAGYRAETSMKRVVDPPHPQHRNRVGQHCVYAPYPGAVRARHGGIEVDHLFARMHSAIGSPCAGDLHLLARDCRHRRLHRILHRAAARLSLPAQKSAAVEFDAECESHAGKSLATVSRRGAARG